MTQSKALQTKLKTVQVRDMYVDPDCAWYKTFSLDRDVQVFVDEESGVATVTKFHPEHGGDVAAYDWPDTRGIEATFKYVAQAQSPQWRAHWGAACGARKSGGR
jgi:hypothetical protein